EAVASRVRELADTGVPFNRIAIVSRRARPSVDLALAALDRFGVPAVARRRVRLGDIPVIRALRAILDAAAEGWSRHGLAELAEQPFFGNDLDARVINLAGYRTRIMGLADWSGALTALIAEAEAREQPMEGEGEGRRSGFPSAATIRNAAAGFARFEVHARTLSEARSATGWLTWLERFLAEDRWGILARIYAVPDGRYDLARTDLAGLRTLTLLLDEWRSALQQWGGADQILTIAEFSAQLQSQLELDVPLWTTVQRGVQVLEGFAAAYRSFDHLFIIGMEAGNFPIRAPTTPLLDEVDRLSLFGQGLPFEPRETWDTRERELFRILLAGSLQSVTVSWSRLDPDGKEVLRSGFVEALAEAAGLDPDSVGEPIPASRVMTPGARLTRGPAAVDQAVHAVRIERLRESGVLSPWNGQITDPALLAWLAEEFGDNRLWSPSQLESYAKCPWAYFSGRLLGVDKREEPDEEIDPAMRGTVLHQALRIFFDGACQRIGGPVLLRQADLTWAQPALADALDQALTFQGSAWLGHPALQGVRRAELARLLARYLNSEVESNEKLFNNRTKLANTLRTAVESSEVGFKDMVLARGGVRIRYRGTIDRVEVGVDERAGAGVSKYLAAVDYKTTKYSAPGGAGKTTEAYADGVVIQIPLYAYALSQLRPGSTLSRLEYRALKQGDTIHSLDLVQVDKKSGTVSDNDEARAQYESALDAAANHVLAARHGEFPAAPPESCGCPPFCHALEICRVAGGPRVKRR
ncbi:MAG: PD-(D/E)XK nuclease family protein, partial [Gemmatimonadota bacterium]